jgi:hypothetical protein
LNDNLVTKPTSRADLVKPHFYSELCWFSRRLIAAVAAKILDRLKQSPHRRRTDVFVCLMNQRIFVEGLERSLREERL